MSTKGSGLSKAFIEKIQRLRKTNIAMAGKTKTTQYQRRKIPYKRKMKKYDKTVVKAMREYQDWCTKEVAKIEKK